MKAILINGKTKIYTLLKANPLVIDTLADFNPHFSKLKNPVLRNLLARRVSILEACRIGKCEPAEFMAKMSALGFEIEDSVSTASATTTSAEPTNPATGLKVVELDVRPILAKGNDPLKAILAEINALQTGECLKVINTFEPIPLISLLKKQGYSCWKLQEGPDLVSTFFIKSGFETPQPVMPV